jgi:hypothetical protein
VHEPASDYLAGPDDPDRARRLVWSDLMQRAYAQDVLVCPRGGGAVRLLAVVQDPAVMEKILKHLQCWHRGPPRGRSVVVESADRESLDVD